MKASEEFVRDWKASHMPVFEVALALRRMGLELRIPIPILRDDEAERWKFRDDGDIECIQIVQVKYRQLDFTCAEDFPFDTIFLDETYKMKESARLSAYAIVNRTRTCMAVILASTREHWTVDSRYDETQRRDCKSWVCPKEFATFVKL